MSNRRLQRVSQLVKEQVGEIIQDLALADCGFVTVTGAEVSSDLKDGKVFVSVIGTPAQQTRALAELERHHGQIQRDLAARVVLKYTPRLVFRLDTTEARASRLEHLLDELGPAPEEDR
jgi:ribosome-binding factor A